MDKSITVRQKEFLHILYKYIKDNGYPPTFEEMRESLHVSSNQSVIDLLAKLSEKGYIKRNSSAARGIVLMPIGYEALGQPPLVPFLGMSHAGFPIEPIEITGEWKQVSSEASMLTDEVFLIKISGDSMINAGIDDGDVVLVKKDTEFVSGNIVLADVDGQTTVKRFMSIDKPPYLYLKPENPKYAMLYFTDTTQLKGKVISILKKGFWRGTR